jgi:hypothetical protein
VCWLIQAADLRIDLRERDLQPETPSAAAPMGRTHTLQNPAFPRSRIKTSGSLTHFIWLDQRPKTPFSGRFPAVFRPA